jgi:hypothetical protein
MKNKKKIKVFFFLHFYIKNLIYLSQFHYDFFRLHHQIYL